MAHTRIIFLVPFLLCLVMAAQAAFKHPGVAVNKGQLDFVKAKIAAKAEPWYSAYTKAKGSRFGRLPYTPVPYRVVECGSYSKPDYGCSHEMDDATAAYTQALVYYYSGNTTYLKSAIKILDAWSAKIVTHNNSNAPLQAAWAAEVFTRAAELVRRTSTLWPATSVTKFTAMLKRAFLPLIIKGHAYSNGNWELSMANAVISIGVFTDNSTIFNAGVKLWRGRVPAYIYLSPPDGALPVPPPGGKYTTKSALWKFWNNPDGTTPFFNGRCQETCRDFGHVGLGFASLALGAETARLQGVDLFSEQKTRLVKGYEYHASWLNNPTRAVPSNLCNGKLNIGKSVGWEIAYNALANRLKLSMPETAKYITNNRPEKTGLSASFETLTHAGVGWAGLTAPAAKAEENSGSSHHVQAWWIVLPVVVVAVTAAVVVVVVVLVVHRRGKKTATSYLSQDS